MVFPIDNFVGDAPVEVEIWELVKKAIPKDCLSFHNYFLETKRPDIILLTPNRGILIIEIKGFLAKNIKSVPDSTVIKFYNKPAVGSPFNQAIEYRNKLIEMMGNAPEISPAFIAIAVCYPKITHDEFYEKKLNKISMEEMTILKEDVANENAFNEKIEKIYDFVYQSMNMHFGQLKFEGEALKKIAYLFAPDFDKDIEVPKDDNSFVPVQTSGIEYYSKLIIFDDQADKTYLQELINEWYKGGKLNLFFKQEDDYYWFRKTIKKGLEEKGIDDLRAFSIDKDEQSTTVHNLVFSYVPSITNHIEIVNGENYEQYEEELSLIDKESDFNFQQYKVEHAELNDIIVKAGAGTGKTYSMISRINYLIWKHKYSADELVDKIAMITFTREAAREMKSKLETNFYEHYVLTNNVRYLEFMEVVENMRISTIHSMAKEILKIYAAKLGLGTNFTIAGSNYEKRKVIHSALNKYISSAGVIETGMPLYQIEKRIELFISQIENKNVDVISDNNVDFGIEESVGGRIRFADFIPVIKEAKREYREDCIENNQVALSDIILQLKLLTKLLDDTPGIVDYLFIDEFQDTDDVQIRLVAKYRKIFSLKLFVVGDTKQCIYRFRGADDAAFKLLKEVVNTTVREIELKKNYRTDRLLLDRMNKTFSAWDKKGDIQYHAGDVLIGTREYNSTDNYYERVFTSDDERDQDLIHEIKRLQNEYPDDRIAVLVRTNFQALDFKNLCDNNGIRIDTSVGGNLYKIEPTLDLLKLLHALKYNMRAKDVYGLYSTAYVAEKLNKIEIDKLTEDEKLVYFKNNLPKSLKKWDSYIERLRLEPVLKVVRDLVDDAKPWTIFSNEMGGSDKEKKANKEYYLRNLDQVFENISVSFNANYLTLNSLINYLEIMILTKQEEDEREPFASGDGRNQIICTTVHKAKGLEYEHVILPYCMYDVASTKTKGDVDLIYSGNKVGYSVTGEDYRDVPFTNSYYKQFKRTEFEDRRKEEIRILYVAMTRAIKSLTYFVDDKNKDKRIAGNWKEMLETGE